MSDMRIMFRHILPNVLGDVIVMGALWSVQSSSPSKLEFHRFRRSPPTPAGEDGARGFGLYGARLLGERLLRGAIFVTVIGFNLFGDGLRDILDPKLRQ